MPGLTLVYIYIRLTWVRTAMMMAEDLSTTATRLAVSTLRATIVRDWVTKQKTPPEIIENDGNKQEGILTDHHNLQFVHQIRSLQLDVNKEDGDESYDDEDDLPAGCETCNVKLPQVPDDDGHVAVEGGADEHEDS